MNVCVRCRIAPATYVCSRCGVMTVTAPRNWRPPKKTNDLAWKRIAKGDWLWDHRAVTRSTTRRDEMLARIREAMARRARVRRKG